MAKDSSQVFLTGVDLGGGPKLPRLEHCKKDYMDIRKIVDEFKVKVEKMVDKQRHEYIQAYENHMQDVQKEVHLLREKVAEIANDNTQLEKSKKLEADQVKFKNDAMKLEADSDELRFKMRTLVRKIYTVEKSRDWLLRKLREAKKKYNHLVKERAKVFEELDASIISQASLSNASSYTLELLAAAKQGLGGSGIIHGSQHIHDVQSRVNKDFGVTRKELLKKVPYPSASHSSSRKADPTDGIAVGPSIVSTLRRQSANKYEEHMSRYLSKLIAARARRKELLDFLEVCAGSLHKGPWSRIKKRPLDKLLNATVPFITNPDAFNSSSKEVLQLVCELAASPLTYEAIRDLINSSPLPNLQQDQSEVAAAQDERMVEGQEPPAEEDVVLDPQFRREYEDLDIYDDGADGNAIDEYLGLSAEQQNEKHAAFDDFQSKLNDVLNRSINHFQQSNARAVNPQLVEGGASELIDDDLMSYFRQEKQSQTLRSLGYFEQDSFLEFR